MTSDEFGSALLAAGKPVHKNDGVWWMSRGPLFCQTLNEFEALTPGSARPSGSKALAGYSHQVRERSQGTREVQFLLLRGDELKGFSIDQLDKGRRNTVRKGLKSVQVTEVTDLEPLWEDLRRIVNSQATRQVSKGQSRSMMIEGKERIAAWRREMREEFSLPGASWWEARHAGRLVAYVTTLAIGADLLFRTTKSETEALGLCPMDALYFRVLEDAAQRPEISRVINGTPIRPSLDRFKEEFGFRCVAIPYYTSPQWAFLFAKTALRLGRRATSAVRLLR